MLWAPFVGLHHVVLTAKSGAYLSTAQIYKTSGWVKHAASGRYPTAKAAGQSAVLFKFDV